MAYTNVQILHRPEGGIKPLRVNDGPADYARRLAQYMRDPSKVRAHTLNEWGRAPTITECADMIANADAKRAAYRAESERLGEFDGDAVDFRPAPTPEALDMQRFIERAEPASLPAPEAANDDPLSAPSVFLHQTVERIARAMKVTVADILGPSRLKRVVQARHVVCWVLSKRGQSLSQIGRRINRDHTTVMNSLQRFETHGTDRMRLVAEHFAGIVDEVAA